MEQRGFVFHTENLSSPAGAVATFLARVSLAPEHVEHVPLEDARGRVLARAIDADADYPAGDRSAMDGFALRAAGVPGRIHVVGEVPMGAVWPRPLEPGTAVRIPTGGMLPSGADAVVPVEETRLEGETLVVAGGLTVGENVNPGGGDMRRGDVLLEPGIRLGAAALALLATVGVIRVPVFKRPRVAVMSSGDELIPPGATPAPGQIRDSNRYAVAASLTALGAEAIHVPTVSDERGRLESALGETLDRCDAVVLTGGSSVGERDRTPAAIESIGGEVVVHGLRVKPGKPTVFAHREGKLILGLPGNPTSAVLILQAVAAPLVAALAGYREVRAPVRARLADAAESRLGWTWFVPVTVKEDGDGFVAHPLPLRSSTVSLLARADGYVAVGPERETIAAGESVEVQRLL